jgi:hypothetical protein
MDRAAAVCVRTVRDHLRLECESDRDGSGWPERTSHSTICLRSQFFIGAVRSTLRCDRGRDENTDEAPAL